MNPEPEQPSEIEFDPNDALEHLGDSFVEHYGLSCESILRLAVACQTFAGIGAQTFSIRDTGKGCALSFVVRRYAFAIEVCATRSGTFITLSASPADRIGRSERLFEGHDLAICYQSILNCIARAEGFGAAIDLVSIVKERLSEWLRAQGDRGF